VHAALTRPSRRGAGRAPGSLDRGREMVSVRGPAGIRRGWLEPAGGGPRLRGPGCVRPRPGGGVPAPWQVPYTERGSGTLRTQGTFHEVDGFRCPRTEFLPCGKLGLGSALEVQGQRMSRDRIESVDEFEVGFTSLPN